MTCRAEEAEKTGVDAAETARGVLAASLVVENLNACFISDDGRYNAIFNTLASN